MSEASNQTGANGPERKPNDGNAFQVLGSTIYLDSPTHMHGVKVNAKQRDGWLTITVEADESIKGWALSYNGKDFPTTDAALRDENARLLAQARADRDAELGPK